MEKRSKFALKADKNLKAMGAGERTSKKFSTIHMSDGTSFKRRNANGYYPNGVPGGNEYTEKRVNRTDRFNTGGTADSSENGGADMGGTLGSSMMKNGGGVGKKITTKVYVNNPDTTVDIFDYEFESDNLDKIKKEIKALRKEVKSEDREYDITGEFELNGEQYSFYGSEVDKMAKGGGLKGNQKKLDLNKNGKLDSQDFKMLRGKKANGGLADVPESFPETDAMSYEDGGSTKGFEYSIGGL